MEGELTELLQKFSLAGNELAGAMLNPEDLNSEVRECEGSLIGRIMGEKFNIPNLEERDRIVEGGPWVIDNQVMILRMWSEEIEENYGAFATAPSWMQPWNLPVHWLTKEVGRKIGAVFKEVKEVIIPQSGGKEGRHLKILALVDLSTPLLRGTVVQTAGTFKWVVFKYERYPDFCYNCGVVGHSERSCKEQRVTMDGELVERERSRMPTGGRLLEFLENADKENRTKQLLDREREVKSLGIPNSSTPRKFDDSTVERGSNDGYQQRALGNQGPCLTDQASVRERQEPVRLEVREEDTDMLPPGIDQAVRIQEHSVRETDIQEELLISSKIQEAVKKQVKRSYRKLKTPVVSRRPLKELSDQDLNLIGNGKRKVLPCDEEMEDSQYQQIVCKKTKSMLEVTH
nr:uncharacterized protein LOC113704814 [Coffea arabica]